jgi:hypothetical protein
MTKTNGSVKFNAAALRRIAVGLLALLNQGYVTAIRLVEPIDIAALFGLGLGIGSLREFVTKATE